MMSHVSRFEKEKAFPAHENTILAAPVLEKYPGMPVDTAYGYLEKAGVRMDPHRHPTHEYYIILEGKGFVEIDGVKEPVSPGDVVEIPPDSMHSMECAEDGPFLWAAFWWN